MSFFLGSKIIWKKTPGEIMGCNVNPKTIGNQGFVIWMTGLSGSGKTTISKALNKELRNMDYDTERLDGDKLRQTISPDAGFTAEERTRHIRRTAYVSQMLAKHGVIPIVSLISPYEKTRNMVREIIDNFICVHVHCPLEVCKERDPKGLYKQALNGEIDNFTGIDDPYEEPKNPEIKVNTNEEELEQSVSKIIDWLKKNNKI